MVHVPALPQHLPAVGIDPAVSLLKKSHKSLPCFLGGIGKSADTIGSQQVNGQAVNSLLASTHSDKIGIVIEAAGFQVVRTNDSLSRVRQINIISGKQAILDKLEIIREYLKGSWQIDIDELRKVVTRRSAEVATLDLTTLN